MAKLRVIDRSSSSGRLHGANTPAHTPGPVRPHDASAGIDASGLRSSALAESGTELRRLLEAVRTSAPTNVTARLEGAIIVLDALAAGKQPSADDLLVPGPYTV